MITRCNIIRVGRVPFSSQAAAHFRLRNSLVHPRPARRYASTASRPNAVTAPPSDVVSPLVGLGDELNRIVPRFDIDADDVQILRGPAEFYDVLKVRRCNCCARC